MTKSARITQADMTRAVMAVKAAGFERARIVMDLPNGKIEIFVGESGDTKVEHNPWDDILSDDSKTPKLNPWDDE